MVSPPQLELAWAHLVAPRPVMADIALIFNHNRPPTKIYRHSKYGFPTASTQATLFELFQIWAQTDFETPIIRFGSLYELIKRKGLTQGDKKTYERIRRDLLVLTDFV